MARLFDDASSQYASVASAPVTAVAFTMACWFNVDNFTADQGLMRIYDSAVNNANNHQLYLEATTGKVGVRSTDSGGLSNSALSSAGGSTGNWHHAGGVWISNSSRTAYLDGGNAVNGGGTRTPAALNAAALAGFIDTAPDRFLSGMMMEAAIWNIALSAGDMAILGGTRISPLLIHPEAIVAYWPLWGDASPEVDLIGRRELALSGGPTKVTHDRMRYPAKSCNPGFNGTFSVTPGGGRNVFAIPG